jgi:hypothetical protein
MKSILLELADFLGEQETILARKAYSLGGPSNVDTNADLIKLETYFEISSKVSKLCKRAPNYATGVFPGDKLFYIKADDALYGTYRTEEEATDRANHLKTKHTNVEVLPAAAEFLPDDRVIINRQVFWGTFKVKEGQLYDESDATPFAEKDAYIDNIENYKNPYELRGE